MTPVLLYITAVNREEAISLARELLSAKLIACANIIHQATSLYWWQGQIEHKHDELIMAKSSSAHVAAVIAKVKELHSYDTPCIVSMPIGDGNPEFLSWIKQQLTSLPETA